ncbi:hypothetical protein C8Q72DRAFT_901842 [Fomitopsis betulina]|nr:hypothetical protein C8Q72DRAFT_901842 [Fomitopsis betulina]
MTEEDIRIPALLAPRPSAPLELLFELEEHHFALLELTEPMEPKNGTWAAKEAYRVHSLESMDQSGNRLPLSLKLARVKLHKVVAVISRLLQSLSTAPFPSIHESNESVAQISRENIAMAARSRDSPSTGDKTANRRETQVSHRLDAIHSFRPLELSTPPVSIYHPVFGRFHQLIMEEQESRKKAFVDPLSLTLDGIVLAAKTSNDFEAVSAITEVKNEIGGGSSDPLAQAECAYVAIHSSAAIR